MSPGDVENLRMPMGPYDLESSFGNRIVMPNERRDRIRRVFGAVAQRYDLINDLMSFGLHRLWKRRMVKTAAPARGDIVIDLAGGTGDVAQGMAGPDRQVLVCDPSLAMMEVGRQRGLEHVSWIAGEAEALPFAAGSVDCITIAFGIRNVTHFDLALSEILRALRPGGRLLCLEFFEPQRWLKPFLVIPRLGAWLARNPEAYQYLIESIRRFPNQEQLKQLFEKIGFSNVCYRNFSFGIVCLHLGSKGIVESSAPATSAASRLI
jgi:demethylmenaquinone methyltransferase/2-methoxy-6-polyprenyl-1,4-benzoquinol methylase